MNKKKIIWISIGILSVIGFGISIFKSLLAGGVILVCVFLATISVGIYDVATQVIKEIHGKRRTPK